LSDERNQNRPAFVRLSDAINEGLFKHRSFLFLFGRRP
jgi:hypothetical protein